MAKRNRTFTRVMKWEPHANDAINLATIRWFALAIEAKGIELYGTNPKVYSDILSALGKGLAAINTVGVKKSIAAAGDCPPGWVPCGDECAPVCSEEEE